MIGVYLVHKQTQESIMTKTVSMEFEEYESELESQFISGKNYGVSDVMKFLKSGQRFHKWFDENNKNGDYATVREGTHWHTILVLLGRENELSYLI